MPNPTMEVGYTSSAKGKRKNNGGKKPKSLARIPPLYRGVPNLYSTDRKQITFNITFPNIVSNNLTETAGNFVFQLNYVPNYANYTAIFDQYQITHVKVSFRSISKPETLINSSAGNTVIPRIAVALDFDNASTPTYAAIQSRFGHQVHPADRNFTISVAPCLQFAVYTGGINAYSPNYGFLDCANANVPHYGIRYSLQATPVGSSNSTFGYVTDAEMTVVFRNHQ